MFHSKDSLFGKRVLVTGHTGFTGGWVSLWLHKLGADVYGYSQQPPTNPNLFEAAAIKSIVNHEIGDVRDLEGTKDYFESVRPDVVLHLAAQPIVKLSYLNPVDTFNVNAIGTLNILEAARSLNSVAGIVCVTTDKVYDNANLGRPFTESDRLGGKDPYSASKTSAEIIIDSYRKSFFSEGPLLVSARGGNIIGGGDWGAHRLMPDLINSWRNQSELKLRYPNATRPWQHVLGLVDGYLRIMSMMISEKRSSLEFAYNFGPIGDTSMSVGELASEASRMLGSIRIREVLPDYVEANTLNLDSSLAHKQLGWTPAWSTLEAIKKTVSWYKEYYSGENAQSLCYRQIEEWEEQTLKQTGD